MIAKEANTQPSGDEVIYEASFGVKDFLSRLDRDAAAPAVYCSVCSLT